MSVQPAGEEGRWRGEDPSRTPDPSRAPDPDAQLPPGPLASADGQPPGAGARLVAFLKRFDAAFTRTFMAMAMAEDGGRDGRALALEQLEGRAE